jgi:hypothetical protein
LIQCFRSYTPVFSLIVPPVFVVTSGYDDFSYASFGYVATSLIFSDHVTAFSVSGGNSHFFAFVVPSIAFDISSYNLFSYISRYNSSWGTFGQRKARFYHNLESSKS